MKRVLFSFLLSVVFLISTACAEEKLIYLYTGAYPEPDGEYYSMPRDGQVDLMEFVLGSGKRTVLKENLLYGNLRDASNSDIAVSPDGRFVAVGIPPDIDLYRDEAKNEDVFYKIPNGLILWNRTSGTAVNIFEGFEREDIVWSKSGRYLKIIGDESVKYYDVKENRIVNECIEDIQEEYDKKLEAVLQIETLIKIEDLDKYVFSCFSGSDEYRKEDLIISGNQTDEEGEYWYVIISKHPKKPVAAVLLSRSYGEPGIFYDEKLYVYYLDKNKKIEIGDWRDSFIDSLQGATSNTMRYLCGWLCGKDEFVVKEDITFPGAEPGIVRTDMCILRAYELQGDATGKVIFDSGPGCLNAVWWANKSSR